MKHIFLLLLPLFLCFLLYFPSVNSNKISFHPDEFYWISTGRIVPLVMTGSWDDQFWHEYYGYANFNGAKWLYGVGFAILGMNDFAQFGYPPQTYYLFQNEEGYFSPTKKEYQYLFWGRIISLVSVSISAGIFALVAYLLSKNVIVGLMSAGLYMIHPLVADVAIHAYADGFFLAVLMMLLLIYEVIVQIKKPTYILPMLVIWGILFAIIVSIKINAAIFLILLILIAVRRWDTSSWKDYVFAGIGFLLMFIFLHPNFIMVSPKTPWNLLLGRMQITQEHMAYFSYENPSHVLLSLPQRLAASFHFLFLSNWSLFWGFFLLLFWQRHRSLLYIGLFVWVCCLAYVVFREGRYFLPVVPFLILIAVTGAGNALRKLRNI